ncbi:hypothetical protein GCM10023092_01850 [Rurimicrobium arvi]|uniref:Peptidase S74 domain-containing protein n=2 Tax=Rurimicrobium arvi TaxID=2049916 RepID=A0ABP8MFD4_9BACT
MWTRSGSNTFLTNSGDYVGVGSSVPTFSGNKFEVVSGGVMFRSARGGMVRFENPNLEEGMAVQTTSGTRADFRVDGSSLKLGFHNALTAVPSSNLMYVTGGGSFGIGLNPGTSTYKLTVNGDTKVQGFLDVDPAATLVNSFRVRGNVTNALVDIQSSNSGTIPAIRAKTGLFVNRTDVSDVNTSGAEIHGQTNGIVTSAIVTVDADATGLNAKSVTSNGNATGVYATGAGKICYGVHGRGSGQNSTNAYGVYGYAWSGLASPNAVYGVYGEIPVSLWSKANCYAGFFSGNVYARGDVYANAFYPFSDQKLKKDIQQLSEGLSVIAKLKPSTYHFRTDEYAFLNLPGEKQYGFIAQELETVLPEAVKQLAITEKDNTRFEYKAVNYTMLIPVLTAAIKEQQEQIEQLRKDLAAATSATNAVPEVKQTINGAFLSQNTPNPFTQTTTISYQLPTDAKTAAIGVYDLNGKELKLYDLGAERAGSVTIDGGSMQPGMYVYTLLLNGVPHETKKMVLTSH